MVQGHKFDVFRWQSLVSERALDSIQIMSTDRHERSLPGEVLVEFVLQSNERFIASFVELDIAQDGLNIVVVVDYSGHVCFRTSWRRGRLNLNAIYW